MDTPFSKIKYEEVFVNDARQDQKIRVEERRDEPGQSRVSLVLNPRLTNNCDSLALSFPCMYTSPMCAARPVSDCILAGEIRLPPSQLHGEIISYVLILAIIPRLTNNEQTALSQHRNLYFVAFLHQVYVYQPTSSFVGVRPKLILTPSLKRPSAPGYISEYHPHAINHLVVGDLGHEEILLFATDSGNVCAYRTERIFSAIEQAEEEEWAKPEESGNTVPCFFMDWVERSAWGLAIHKYARLIAVSANTSEITVWAFALTDRAESEHKHLETNPSFMNDWIRMSTSAQFQSIGRLEPQQRRSRNIRITLHGHPNNIPCVGFLNSEVDRHGEWLVSTDITNKLFVWRIWESPLPVFGWNLNPVGRPTMRHYLGES